MPGVDGGVAEGEQQVRLAGSGSDGERLQHLRAVLPCTVRVTAAMHPLFGVAGLLGPCGGTVVAARGGTVGRKRARCGGRDGHSASAPATPTELVLDGEGIHALHGLVVALQRRPVLDGRAIGSARPCSRQRFREGEPICAPRELPTQSSSRYLILDRQVRPSDGGRCQRPPAVRC